MPKLELSDNKNTTPEFEQIIDDVWINPIQSGYKFACCDCGLVHDMDFRVHNDRAYFRVRRNQKDTEELRKI